MYNIPEGFELPEHFRAAGMHDLVIVRNVAAGEDFYIPTSVATEGDSAAWAWHTISRSIPARIAEYVKWARDGSGVDYGIRFEYVDTHHYNLYDARADVRYALDFSEAKNIEDCLHVHRSVAKQVLEHRKTAGVSNSPIQREGGGYSTHRAEYWRYDAVQDFYGEQHLYACVHRESESIVMYAAANARVKVGDSLYTVAEVYATQAA